MNLIGSRIPEQPTFTLNIVECEPAMDRLAKQVDDSVYTLPTVSFERNVGKHAEGGGRYVDVNEDALAELRLPTRSLR